MGMEKYREILDTPHRISPRHLPMPLDDRAAQFAPFAALTGHEAQIQETARLTDPKILLDEQEKETMERKLRWLRDHLGHEPQVYLSFYVADRQKEGGSYQTYKGPVIRVDSQRQELVLQDGSIVPMEDIKILDLPERWEET